MCNPWGAVRNPLFPPLLDATVPVGGEAVLVPIWTCAPGRAGWQSRHTPLIAWIWYN